MSCMSQNFRLFLVSKFEFIRSKLNRIFLLMYPGSVLFSLWRSANDLPGTSSAFQSVSLLPRSAVCSGSISSKLSNFSAHVADVTDCWTCGLNSGVISPTMCNRPELWTLNSNRTCVGRIFSVRQFNLAYRRGQPRTWRTSSNHSRHCSRATL